MSRDLRDMEWPEEGSEVEVRVKRSRAEKNKKRVLPVGKNGQNSSKCEGIEVVVQRRSKSLDVGREECAA